jgi:hypothetical protein
VKQLKFFHGRPYILATDSMSTVFLVNYQELKSWKVIEPADFDSEEAFTVTFIPGVTSNNLLNEDFAFIGTNRGNVYIFSVSKV